MLKINRNAALLISLYSPFLFGQQNFESVDVATTDLGNGIYLLTGTGGPPAGNIVVSVGRDGAFIVDDQYAELQPQIKEAIAKLNGGDGDVRFILNTHFHNDHTGANDLWSHSGSTIVAHHNTRKRMQAPWQFGAMSEPPREQAALPIVTFEDHLRLHLNDETIETHYVPNAHTDGDVLVKFVEANLIHAGDVINPNFFPLFDTSGGGSFDGYIEAVQTLATIMDEETRVVPGHGSVIKRPAVVNYHQELITLRDILRPLANSNQSIADIIDLKPLADYRSWAWSATFMNVEHFISLAINSLRAQ